MPSLTKSPPQLVERFAAVTAPIADAERRQMFGYPCLFVGGNMVTGLHGSSWFVRLADPDRQRLLDHDGAGPFEPMAGRPMTGYAVLPASIMVDDEAVQAWVNRAIDFGRSLPPKAPKALKRRRQPA